MYGRSERVSPGRYRHTNRASGHSRSVTVVTGRTVYRLNSNRLSRARGIHVWCEADGNLELIPAVELGRNTEEGMKNGRVG